jgi:hypothetical protein
VLFPTVERPRVPGLLHIGYVIGATARDAVVAYTTSQPWPVDIPLALGARVFSPAEAVALNQNRGFLLRIDLLARLPMTAVWFPDIAKPGQGVIAVAPAALQRELTALGAALLQRRGRRVIIGHGESALLRG